MTGKIFVVTYTHPGYEPQEFEVELPPGYPAVVIPIFAECMGIERLEIRQLPTEEDK